MRRTPRPWEVGSDFHWSQAYLTDSGEGPRLPPGCQFYSTGRGALAAMLASLPPIPRRRRLLVPSYFHQEALKGLTATLPIETYQDLPGESSPRFRTLRARPGDVVLVVNFFGVRDASPWQEWADRHPGALRIEDHTHDPFSSWAKSSTADYGFASLRKTLPLPDGGLAWSPVGRPVPSPVGFAPPAARKKLAAMRLKAVYLEGAAVPKRRFRKLQREGERGLAQPERAPALAFTRRVLPRLRVEGFRRQRRANVRVFLERLGDGGRLQAERLFDSWPRAACPFNPVLRFSTPRGRDAALRRLIRHRVYAAVHWNLPAASPDPVASSLSRRVLTLPLDQRYGRADVARVLEILEERKAGAAVTK